MANEVQKAQFALMAALDPENFINLAVEQGFTPQQMRDAVSPVVPLVTPQPYGQQPPAPVGAIPRDINSGPQTPPMLQGRRPNLPPGPDMVRPGMVGNNTAPQPPAPMPQELMGPLQPKWSPFMGPPPTGALPPEYQTMPPVSDPSQALAARNTIPPMGAPPIGQLPAQQAPGMQMPDINAQIAGNLMGLPSNMQPVMLPPTPAGPRMPPVPPEMPAPQNGIMTDPSVMAMTPDPSGNAGLVPQGGGDVGQALAGLAGTIFPPLGALGGPSPTPMAGPNVSQFDLLTQGMPTMAPSPVQAPPVPTPGVQPVPTGKPTAVETAEATQGVNAPKSEAAKAEEEKAKQGGLDALAQVGKTFASGGSGGGRGGPGGAGIGRGQIAEGELAKLIMGLTRTGQVSLTPFGKLF